MEYYVEVEEVDRVDKVGKVDEVGKVENVAEVSKVGEVDKVDASRVRKPNYEVIICDDSTDETKDLVNDWRNHPLVKISHRESREGFKGGALREAVKLMDPRTEFVMVFDADFLPYPDTITSFLKNFQVVAGGLDFGGKAGKVPNVSKVSEVSKVPNATPPNPLLIRG